MFLTDNDPKRPIRNGYWYGANRVMLTIGLQGLATGLLLGLVPAAKPTDYINFRETIVPAVLLGLNAICAWWVTKRGMDVTES